MVFFRFPLFWLLFLLPLLSQARSLAQIQETGRILVGTEGTFYPFSYTENRKLTGYEVELMQAITQKMGLLLQWRTMPFDALLPAVRQERIDVAISAHTKTEKRAEQVDFTSPHACTGAIIIGKKGGSLTKADLKGKTVAVQMSTSYVEEAKKISGLQSIKNYRTDPEAFEALKENNVDAWISDKSLAKRRIDEEGAQFALGEPLSEERFSILVPKHQPELLKKLDEALSALEKENVLKTLSQKYFQDDITCLK